MSSHPQTCRCRLHALLTPTRHAGYEQLARAILGPLAPPDGPALAHALAEHARLIAAARPSTPKSERRAA